MRSDLEAGLPAGAGESRPWPVRHGWRLGLVAAALVVALPWNPIAGPVTLLTALPVLVWSTLVARSRRTRLVVGAVLIAVSAALILPRPDGWPVASVGDLVTWYPLLAAATCISGAAADRRHTGGTALRFAAGSVAGVAAVLLVACVAGGVVLLRDGRYTPGDEGVLPMPAGLTATELISCGAEECVRSVTVTGDRAETRVPAHLAARGFDLLPDPPSSSTFTYERETGILIPHEVHLGYAAEGPGEVRVFWYVVPLTQ